MPGFRTAKWWKKVIALSGYLIIIITAMYSPMITITDKILDAVFYIFLFGIPFALITNLGAIRGKLPLFKMGKLIYTVMGWCLSLMLTFVLASGVLAATDNLHSEQYKEQAGIIDHERQAKNLEVVKVASQEKIQARKAAELIKTINTEARTESHQIAVKKALANALAVEEKKITETKAIEDKTASDAKAIADKVATDAKVIEAEKAANAKAIENRDRWIFTQNQLKIKKKTTNAQVINEKAAYQAWVKAQFSLSSGENMRFVELIKKPLNDDTSFSHVKTTYVDKGDYLIIDMTYRAKNTAGELIVQNATAKTDYKTNTISVISQSASTATNETGTFVAI